jgi:general secretion pathway protein A
LARAYLEYGIKQREGFVVLTGEVGTGKTTLLKSLLRARERNHRLGVLYQTSRAIELLEMLLQEFEVRGHYPNRTAKLAAFNQFLLTAYGRGEHVVLLVDEAQNLTPEALEEIRLFSNLQTEKEPLLQVILVGQPGLRDRLRHPALRQLAQRVAVHFHLNPLSLAETKEYVRFRLARAGGSGIFTDSALDRLFEYTRGVPRRLNAWCDLALVAGFAEGIKNIDGDFIDTLIVTQGGSLEGPEGKDNSISAEVMPLPETARLVTPVDEGLSATVEEILARLSRLERMVLELTSQLVPVLNQFLINPSILNSAPPAPDDKLRDTVIPVENLDPDISPPLRKWGWFKIFKK